MSAAVERLDGALERVMRLRNELLAEPDAVDRAARLAVLFESEARTWSQFYELSSLRIVWRAALATEAGARANARLWARRAATANQPRLGWQERRACERATDRKGAVSPRQAAFATTSTGRG